MLKIKKIIIIKNYNKNNYYSIVYVFVLNVLIFLELRIKCIMNIN
jgi:hypothetical protein